MLGKAGSIAKAIRAINVHFSNPICWVRIGRTRSAMISRNSLCLSGRRGTIERYAWSASITARRRWMLKFAKWRLTYNNMAVLGKSVRRDIGRIVEVPISGSMFGLGCCRQFDRCSPTQQNSPRLTSGAFLFYFPIPNLTSRRGRFPVASPPAPPARRRNG